MSDFYQTGLVATFHRLGRTKLERLEDELMGFAVCPIAQALPALYSEVEGPALPAILEELKKVKYLRQIVVTMGGSQFRWPASFACRPTWREPIASRAIGGLRSACSPKSAATLRSSADVR